MEYGTGAIMAVPAHDERDAEFARGVRAADRPRDRRRRQARQLGAVRRAAVAGGRRRDHDLARRAGQRAAGDQLPPARLELLAPALLGLPDPGRLLRRLRHRPRSRGRAARAAARGGGLPAEGPAAARLQRGVHERLRARLRQARAARGGHDGHVRRLVVVLPALHRSAQRRTRRSTGRWPTRGCRSTSTSAASTTRRATCSTRASS